MSDLDSILSGQEELEAEQQQTLDQPVEEQPETLEAEQQDLDQVEAEQSGDEPEEPQTGEEEGEPPSSDKVEQTVPLAALLAERDKHRQELYQLAQAQPQQQVPVEQPDWEIDPTSAGQTLEQRVEQRLLNERVNMSVEMARTALPDFDEVKGRDATGNLTRWQELGQREPTFLLQAMQSPNPAKFAYDTVKRLDVLEQVGDDPGTYREKLKEELRQELMSEVQAREPEQQPSLPQSLAGARSAGNRSSGPAWAGPAPLDELLK